MFLNILVTILSSRVDIVRSFTETLDRTSTDFVTTETDYHYYFKISIIVTMISNIILIYIVVTVKLSALFQLHHHPSDHVDNDDNDNDVR